MQNELQNKANSLLGKVDNLFKTRVFHGEENIQALKFIQCCFFNMYQDNWFTLYENSETLWKIEFFGLYAVVKYKIFSGE